MDHIVYEAQRLKATEALSVLIVTSNENVCEMQLSSLFALYESVELLHDLKPSLVWLVCRDNAASFGIASQSHPVQFGWKTFIFSTLND